MKRLFLALGITGLLVTVTVNEPSVSQLINPGSVWKYNDNGVDLGTTWCGISYNDVGWSSGPAQLGFGERNEATTISYGGDKKNKYPCYYFRYNFTVANPAAYEVLTLKVLRDDGCVVYLNSTEVERSNMPSGTITYDTWASIGIEGDAEDFWHEFSVDPALLNTGTNVIAVEVHIDKPGSKDLSFNLELTGSEGPGENDPPVVSDIPDQTIQEGESFSTINLDEYVTDPDNTDEEMTWTHSGNSDLSVDINEISRVATITAPYPEWAGAETITFTATDPGALSSSDPLGRQREFRKLPVSTDGYPKLHGYHVGDRHRSRQQG